MYINGNDSDRRVHERMDLSLPILLPDQDGKTINIGTSGVYFEVITNNIDAFPPGAAIPFQINAATTTPGFEGKKFKLEGKGFVVRNDIIDVTSRCNRLGIAVEFKDKLDIFTH